MTISPKTFWLNVVIMASSAYLMRILGYWLACRIRFNPIARSTLEYLPGCILMAITGPMLAHSPIIEIIAAGVVVIIMWRFSNLLLAMLAGMALVISFHLFKHVFH